jgi:hypothetical protein
VCCILKCWLNFCSERKGIAKSSGQDVEICYSERRGVRRQDKNVETREFEVTINIMKKIM